MNKDQIRKHYLHLRREIPDKAAKSNRICAALKTCSFYRSAAVVALYCATADEADTAAIILDAFRAGKRVCLPQVRGEEMHFLEISPTTAFAVGAFGIKEPQSGKRMDKAEIGCIIVPLVAADTRGNRLGHGGGYYDRFLADYTGSAVGICFAKQLSATPLPTLAHDVSLDAIVTENGVLLPEGN